MHNRKKQAQVESSKQAKDGNINNTKTDSLHPLETKNGINKGGVQSFIMGIMTNGICRHKTTI
jgi:hypothetical protein